MKPVSYHKIVVKYLDLRQFHFGLLMLLKGTFAVFLVVCCQRKLCARRNVLYAWRFAVVFRKLEFLSLPRFRSACGV
jgi:hypothetical protein